MTPPLVVGIAGGSGSGKTTVVREIVRGVAPEPVGVLHHDAYYRDRSGLPAEERASLNFDHPDALDTALLASHLDALRLGSPVDVPIYDFESHTRRTKCLRIEPARLIVVDGLLVLADPAVRDRLDLKVYVDTAPDVRFIRRLERDLAERGRSVEDVVRQYLTSVRPMHLGHVEPSRRHADVIIEGGGYNREAVGRLVARLREALA